MSIPANPTGRVHAQTFSFDLVEVLAFPAPSCRGPGCQSDTTRVRMPRSSTVVSSRAHSVSSFVPPRASLCLAKRSCTPLGLFLSTPCSVENLRGGVRYLSMQASSEKNRLQQFTTLALAVSKRVFLPNHGSKFAPKTYTQPQLLACLLLKEYLRLDYRITQEMLELSDRLRSALQLSRVPDHSTLWWFARHKLKPALLQAALEESVRSFEHYLQWSSDRNDANEGDAPKGHDGASQNERLTRVVALDSIYWPVSLLQLTLLPVASEA